MVDDFILRKAGKQEVDYFHPDLTACLDPTYGVIVYQEQVMQISQIIGGYTLGGADMLRRAMGKKKIEEMDKHRAIFAEGARKKGYTTELATHLFDLMAKFAEYGFNKSHTAAYAVVTYQTAWLKAHHGSGKNCNPSPGYRVSNSPSVKRKRLPVRCANSGSCISRQPLNTWARSASGLRR